MNDAAITGVLVVVIEGADGRRTVALGEIATVKTVASLLGVSSNIVQRLIADGSLRAVRLTRKSKCLILLDSVHEYEKQLAAKYGLDK
jgi:excisionase family DNA binding protein